MRKFRRVVVDASVAVKWYIPEAGSEQAAVLLRESDDLLAPDVLAAEFGNALWKKLRRGVLTLEEAQLVIDGFVSAAAIELQASAPMLAPAFEIAARYGHPVYDALYVALALQESCPLVTDDRRFVQAFRGSAIEPYVVPLTSL